ncbi:hypothetical protein EDD15DRAFT_2330172 [Pisolithus albus]|nr:hypothetical protein EDD15DRAFT_2330172 [Pisolithus albus]
MWFPYHVCHFLSLSKWIEHEPINSTGGFRHPDPTGYKNLSNQNAMQWQNRTRSVRRRQVPMTAAYAFTDYRSQGQTLLCIIVDIATPPSGGLNLFNLYVALSRSARRHCIRLLGDFNEKLFWKSHCNELILEDDRLEEENEKTCRSWIILGKRAV